MKIQLFKDRIFYRKLFGVTIPAALQNLMLAAVAACDAFMLGRLDQDMMSAVSLAAQIQFIQNIAISSVTAGAVLFGAQYYGKGDMKAIEKVFSISFRLSVPISALFFLACEFCPELLMRIYTDEAVLIGIGSGYLKIAGWSYLITGITQCYLANMKVTGHVTQSSVISVIGVVLNIILNSVLIFGLLGAPALDVSGAAIATLISRIAELAICVFLSYRAGYMRVTLPMLFVRCGVLMGDFVKKTLPILGAGLLWGIGFSSYTSFMGHLGTDSAAANSVAAVVRDLVCCMSEGFAVGAKICVGNELGAGRLEKGKLYGQRLCIISFILGFICTLIMLALTPMLVNSVKLTDQARKYFIRMMLVMSFYMIGRCVNTVVVNGIFTTGGDTLFDFYSLIAVMWCFSIPLAALGTYLFHWPVLVVYCCTCVDEVGKIPWVMAHFRRYKWVKNLTR